MTRRSAEIEEKVDTRSSPQEPAEAIKTPPTPARQNIQVVAAIAIAGMILTHVNDVEARL
jgi:hypothetical protein